MRGIVLVGVGAVALVGGAMFVKSRGLSLPTPNLPTSITLPKVAVNPQNDANGNVLGTQTTVNVSHFADNFGGIGQAILNVAGAVGVQTVKNGQNLVQNAQATPTSSADVIDMGKVVQEVSSKVESIPGNLVNQAKIEYCKQVLTQATASASPNPK